MCDKNINEILNVDFSLVNDNVNWTHNGTNAIETVNGQLVLNPNANDTTFTRTLGVFDNTNNRIKLFCSLNTEFVDTSAPTTIEVEFQIWNNNQKILESTAEIDGLSAGMRYNYMLEREYIIDSSITGNLELRIVVPLGWQQKVFLNYLKCIDYNFCEDDVRSYFIIDSLFNESFTAQAAGIQLLEWKIDGVETLTNDFFNDTTVVGGNPFSQWLFAKSDLDGNNRVQEDEEPNTFNPFKDEFKLDFDNVNSYFGGKPTGVTNGKDYGTGILQIGVDKPEILNGELITHKGPFFIDIDYSKSLKVVFNVVLNKVNSSLFASPTFYRKYFIEWDSANCVKNFYYVDQLTQETVDQKVNGFLFGLPTYKVDNVSIACDQSFAPQGGNGNFSFVIDFGTSTGTAGIDYQAYGVPDRFIIEWNGQTFDTGFVGSSFYDNDLIDAGVNPADINTANPTNGAGTLTFNKDQALPSQAVIKVLAPIGNTAWLVKGICPS